MNKLSDELGNVMHHPNPVAVKFDGVSRNLKSFHPILIKYESSPEQTDHYLLRLLSTHGISSSDGAIFRRDSSGFGMWNTLVHAVDTPAFKEVGDTAILGMDTLRRILFGLFIDNGGGMLGSEISFGSSVAEYIPWTRNEHNWGLDHRLECIYERVMKESQVAVNLADAVTTVQEIISFSTTPKRHEFLNEVAITAGFNAYVCSLL